MEDTTEKANINRSELADFIKAQNKIRSVAEKIMDLYCTLHNIRYAEFLNFINLDEYRLYFEGEETWAYGGYDKHSLDIPVSYLYDENWFERESKIVVQRELEKQLAAEQRLLKESERIRNEELTLLKELKEKYEAQA